MANAFGGTKVHRTFAFIRLTPGRMTTEAEIDQAAAVFNDAVTLLRRAYG